MRVRLAVAAALAVVGAAAAPALAHAATVPCSGSAVVALDVSAAATVPGADGRAPVGVAAARRLVAAVTAPGAAICSQPASAAVEAKLRAIAALYKTNFAAAHRQLLALLQAIEGGTIQVDGTRRLAAALSSPCPALDRHISIPGKVTADRSALQAAQKAGDAGAEAQASSALQKDFSSFASGVASGTPGDYVAIAQAAEAIGNDSAAASALSQARAAAAAALKELTPADPCKASGSEIDCWVKAQMVAELTGAGDPDQALAKKLSDCIQLWTFTMRVTIRDPLGTWGFVFGGAHMRVGPGTLISPAEGEPGQGHGLVLPGTMTCNLGGSAGTTHVAQSAFRFTVQGTKTAGAFDLTIDSPTLQVKASGCAAKFGPIYATVLRTIHLSVPVPPGQRVVTYNPPGGTGKTEITLRRIDR